MRVHVDNPVPINLVRLNAREVLGSDIRDDVNQILRLKWENYDELTTEQGVGNVA